MCALRSNCSKWQDKPRPQARLFCSTAARTIASYSPAARPLTHCPAEGNMLGGVAKLVQPAISIGLAIAGLVSGHNVSVRALWCGRVDVPLVVAACDIRVPPPEVGPGGIEAQAHPVGLVEDRDEEALWGWWGEVQLSVRPRLLTAAAKACSATGAARMSSSSHGHRRPPLPPQAPTCAT